ncbi:Transglutaminase elicitor [Phytophthora cactorum]|nr:Transglutaminase elicitor [Phytophthora cactorum]
MQQTAASSLYYDPLTTSGTDGKISGKFPARGAEVADQDCTFTVEVDPTLPDITTISTVPVTYPDLLASTTTAPADPVSTKVGKAIVSKETPTQDADQDAYIGKSTTLHRRRSPLRPSRRAPPRPLARQVRPRARLLRRRPARPRRRRVCVQGTPGNAKPKDCATGWEETKPTRKLRDSAVSGRELDEKLQTKRQLEANTNKDIAKLEAYFGTSMETTLKNLPTEGVHTPSPWPGPYWPTYQDGINVQWSQGEASPAEKYATAFGLDPTDFMNKVSKDNGIDSMSKRTKCTSDNDCASLNDGSGCGIRAGQARVTASLPGTVFATPGRLLRCWRPSPTAR